MHRFRDISKNVFQRIYKTNFVIFLSMFLSTFDWFYLINIQHVYVYVSTNVNHRIFNCSKKYIFIFLTPSFKGKNFEVLAVIKGIILCIQCTIFLYHRIFNFRKEYLIFFSALSFKGSNFETRVY